MADRTLGSAAGGAAGERAARLLLIDREVLANEVTAALYAESPELLARHGERGREKCLQDMRYNVEHLTPAVELTDPSMFARYVEWVEALLRSRGVASRDVVRSLQLLRERCALRYPAGDAETIAAIIDAGLAAIAS
ncbi:MAG: hypothetical protein ACJ79K_09920 [Gemmatimonadaceae bacterium]